MSTSRDPGFDPMLFAKYASLKDPEKVLPLNVYYWHTPRTLTTIEQYPKSKIHCIMLPRVGAPPRVPANLKDLYTLLTSPEVSKSEAETLLREMREDAEVLKAQLEEEMIQSFDFKSDIWMGFKIAPSFRYLHLHVMSDDLAADGMKLPKHFFSFHPEHGEFLALDEVLSWFEIVDERYEDNLRDLRKKQLKLSKRGKPDRDRATEERPVYDCYHNYGGIECRFEARDFPTMKKHLNEHFIKRREEGQRRKETRQNFERQQANRRARLAEEKRREDEGGDGTEPGTQVQPAASEDEVIRED